MSKYVIILITGTCLSSILIILSIWFYQANYAKELVIFDVPKWTVNKPNPNPNTSYSIAVGKSQIHKYGTLWEKTVGDGWISNFPVDSPFRLAPNPTEEI